jgi:hypothetical protein
MTAEGALLRCSLVMPLLSGFSVPPLERHVSAFAVGSPFLGVRS